MKIKTILAVGALSLGITGLASATTTNFVYITGSTAFRPSTFDAVYSLFSPAPVVTAGKCSTVGTLDVHTGGQMMFAGNISSQPYVIKCAWSGSEAGIVDVTTTAGNKHESFLDTGLAGQTNTATLSATDSHVVDIAMADNNQTYSLTKTPSLTGAAVGIVPFLWIKNAQTNATLTTAPADWARLNNVTDPAIRVALNGGAPLALFTGNSADTNWVYVAGRDDQSGTRVNTLLDCQYGLVNQPSQIEINTANGAANIQGGVLLSAAGANNGGQNSGGTLATSMTIVGSTTNGDAVYFAASGTQNSGFYAIAYVGLYDADVSLGIQGAVAAPGGNAVALSYNGVAETAANIENGTYSFWGNEWIYQSKNNLSTGGSTVYGLLKTAIPTHVDHSHAFATTDMFAKKTNSASDATHN